ncbi:MAG: response regulator transcription factor [Chitinophagaceae bacterium]|nr:response regulator transcription factor [Chitinophagaceae bacterium]
MAVKVLIYEDNDALRNGLEDLLSLSDEFEVAGAYPNCVQVASDIAKLDPDVVLMDIDMPEITGIEALKIIRNTNRELPVIMLTVFDDNKNVLDAICAGASGYLLKKNASDKLVSSIKEVLSGGAPLSPAIAKMVISSMHSGPGGDYHFTEKEKEILKLLCKGMSYKMIAAETKLSFETIRSYIKNIYSKLQVHSATEAISKAMNERLV